MGIDRDKSCDAEPLLSVVILTHNEAVHIERAIKSVESIASRIVVVDSGSTDDTTLIARRCGAQVITHAFESHARQFQWALDNIAVNTTWVMRLDADEVVEADLVAELFRWLPELSSSITGVNLRRKHIFMGKWIRHGGRYPLRLLRIWRNGHASVEDRWMDEHLILDGGKTITLKGGFADNNLKGIGCFIEKHNHYATREAVDALNLRYSWFPPTRPNASRQARVKRWVKEAVYNRLPLGVAPLVYFIWRYIVRLGFLDGKEGLIYHFLQGFWYRFLVGAKMEEIERHISGARTEEETLERLEEITDLSIKAVHH